MKSFKGNLFILTTMVITLAVWLTAVPAYTITSLDVLRHTLAGLGMNGFFLVFVLASRNRIIERWFGGLEYVYAYHKYLAIFSVAAILAHVYVTEFVRFVGPHTIGKLFAGPSLWIFLAVGFISIFYKKYFSKIVPYEIWRWLHRLMLIAYIFGLLHTYLSSRYDLLQLTPLGIWMGITSIVGLISAIYIVFFYQSIAFPYRGKVAEVNRIGASAVEIRIQLNKKLNYQQGQYAFIKIFQRGIETAPHPFSIAGGDGNSIIFIIKACGDYTQKLYNHLDAGTEVAINGPYGRMIFDHGKQNQIWLAGGIGITPFLSRLSGDAFPQNVELFYSYRGKNDEIYKEFLEEYQNNHPNFKVHFIDTNVAKRLDLSTYVVDDQTSVFMCGPFKMMHSYAKVLQSNSKDADLIYEGFSFM